MRAMTVRQPWAWAIVHGGKGVENRTRNIAGGYRGPVAIHAGLAFDDGAWASESFDEAFRKADRDGSYTIADTGAVIGVVDLVDVHWSGMECSRGEVTCHEYDLCTPWAMAYHHHLVLANPRPLATPVPWRGQLGLWTLPGDIAAAIREQVQP